MQTSASEGMLTLRQDLNRLVKEEVVTKETAAEYVIGGSFDDLSAKKK